MRRMINETKQKWIDSVSEYIVQDGTDTEFGGNVYIDGDLTPNRILDSSESEGQTGQVLTSNGGNLEWHNTGGASVHFVNESENNAAFIVIKTSGAERVSVEAGGDVTVDNVVVFLPTTLIGGGHFIELGYVIISTPADGTWFGYSDDFSEEIDTHTLIHPLSACNFYIENGN